MTAPRLSYRQRRHPLVAGVAAFNAISAGFGAVGLITGWLALDATVTGRLPWGSAVVGGIALGVIVVVPNGLFTPRPESPAASCCAR